LTSRVGDGQENGGKETIDDGISAEKDGSGGDGEGQKAPKDVFLMCFEGFGMGFG